MGFKQLFLALLLGIGLFNQGKTQEVSIMAENPGYSGIPISFSIKDHPFLDQASLQKTITGDDSGKFRLDLKLEEPCVITLRTGVYKGSLFIEPGKSYPIQLPAFRDVSYAEKISPFYEPINIGLKVAGRPEDVNNQVYSFDSLFYYLNEEVVLSRRTGGKALADSLISILESPYDSATGDWFSLHRRYKEGLMKLNEGKTGLEELAKNFLGEQVMEKHPAYLTLFGAMFKDFLVYYNRTSEGEGIRQQINRNQNLDSLRSLVANHPAVLNDSIRDLILLQELPSLFHRTEYHKEAILILLDSLEADPVKAAYGPYAEALRDKLSSLMVGYPPPDFQLTDTQGSQWSPSDFKGKYTYLMFCTPDNYGCMMEYPYLKSYVAKHSEYLEVVSIMVAESEDQVAPFMEQNQYTWKAIYYGDNSGILDNYQVKAFPVAYLLGPDGNIILSPAPLPTDGFEQQLFQIMRSRGDI